MKTRKIKLNFAKDTHEAPSVDENLYFNLTTKTSNFPNRNIFNTNRDQHSLLYTPMNKSFKNKSIILGRNINNSTKKKVMTTTITKGGRNSKSGNHFLPVANTSSFKYKKTIRLISHAPIKKENLDKNLDKDLMFFLRNKKCVLAKILKNQKRRNANKVKDISLMGNTNTKYKEENEFDIKKPQRRETLEFFQILANEKKKGKKSQSAERKEFLFCKNQLLKLKSDVPQFESKKFPVYNSLTQLNKFLIRDLKVGNENDDKMQKELILKKEQVINKTMENISNLKRKTIEFEGHQRRIIQIERPPKYKSNKGVIQKLDEELENHILKDEKFQMKLKGMVEAIDDLNETPYQTMEYSKDKVSKQNLEKVAKFLIISKLKFKHKEQVTEGFSSQRELNNNYLQNQYYFIKCLRNFIPSGYLKRIFKPKTIRKFNELNGNYFGFS